MSVTGKKGYFQISSLYGIYKVRMNDIWRAFNFYEFALTNARGVAKKSPKDYQLNCIDLVGINNMMISRTEMFGIIDSQMGKSNQIRAFLDGVITTENFLKDVALIIYADFPDRLKTESDVETDKREIKLINVILDSFDKNEMLSRITEEKIRSIFYGNPSDFFKKDKANLRLKKFFASNHQLTLQHFSEIIARRNIYVHNDGRIDRKYLREVHDVEYKLNTKAVISTFYLRHSLMILKVLGLLVTSITIKENYHIEPSKNILGEVKATNKRLNV